MVHLPRLLFNVFAAVSLVNAYQHITRAPYPTAVNVTMPSFYPRTPTIISVGSTPKLCGSSADCGPDAPLCELPFLFDIAPYNQPQRVCMLSPAGNPCETGDQCTTGSCPSWNSGKCAVDYYGGCTSDSCSGVPANQRRCRWPADCSGAGRCGTAQDVRADGSSLEGKCLTLGGDTCTDAAECQSRACTNGRCEYGAVIGQLAPNQFVCGGSLSQVTRVITAASELSDGTFAISPMVYNIQICAPLERELNKGVGTECSNNWECATGRCAGTKGSSSPVCSLQPVGAGCYDQRDCGSGRCSNSGRCQASAVGQSCYYSSDCTSRNCEAGVCGEAVQTLTTTSSTTSTSTSTTSSTSTAASTSSSSSSTTSSTTRSTSSSTSTSTSSRSTTTTRSSSSATSTSSTTSRTSSTTSRPASTSSSSRSTSSSSVRTTSTSTSSRSSSSSSTSSRSGSTTSRSTSTTTPTSTRFTTSTKKSSTTTTATQTLLPLGATCATNTICQSAYCRAKLNADGTRSSQATCDVKKASGNACYQNAGCISGVCTKGALNGTCK
ncbi:hypothetical protein V8E36_002819 [Tilletia maclaganii]